MKNLIVISLLLGALVGCSKTKQSTPENTVNDFIAALYVEGDYEKARGYCDARLQDYFTLPLSNAPEGMSETLERAKKMNELGLTWRIITTEIEPAVKIVNGKEVGSKAEVDVEFELKAPLVVAHAPSRFGNPTAGAGEEFKTWHKGYRLVKEDGQWLMSEISFNGATRY